VNKPFRMSVDKFPFEIEQEDDPMYEDCEEEIKEKIIKTVEVYQNKWVGKHKNLKNYGKKKKKHKNKGQEIEDEVINNLGKSGRIDFNEDEEYFNSRRWDERYV